MKKIALISFLMLCSFLNVNAQGFGSFASGVFITKNGTFTGYSVSGAAPNQIGTTPFSGNLGTFQRNSGTLVLNGGETKTYKQNWGNVCGTTLYYSIHPTGSTGTYNGLNLPYKAGCNAGTFSDGLGGCSGNDQKWSSIAYAVDLTTYCPGDYTMDIYYNIPGSNSNTYDCGDNQSIGSTASPAGSVTFTIAPPPLTITGDTVLCGYTVSVLTAKGCPGGSISWTGDEYGGQVYTDSSFIVWGTGAFTANCSQSGCTNTNSATVNITRKAKVDPPYVSASPVSCPGSTAVLTASGYTGTIKWSNGETAASFTAPMGTYTATTTNDGCTSKPSEAVTVVSCTPICPDSGNLMVNGSFEQSSDNPGTTWAGSHQTGWFELNPNNFGITETWASGYQGVPAVTGNLFVELNFADLGILGQNVYVTPNVPLTLSWYHRAREASPNEMVRVEVEDLNSHQIIDTFISSVDKAWHQFSTTFVAPTSWIQIRFVSLNASGDGTDTRLGNLLDDVVLNYASCTSESMSKTAVLKTAAASVTVSPNPATDIAALKLTGFTNQPVSIQLTNINGVVMNAAKYDYVYGMNIPLDMSTLPAGMYFVKAQQGDKVVVVKVVKK